MSILFCESVTIAAASEDRVSTSRQLPQTDGMRRPGLGRDALGSPVIRSEVLQIKEIGSEDDYHRNDRSDFCFAYVVMASASRA